MMTIAGALMLLALWRWRDLPVMRPLRRLLVERSAPALNGLTRRHLLFALLLAAVLIAGGEWLAMMGPLDMSLVLLWDVASIGDAAIAVMLLAGTARFDGAMRMARAMIARRRVPRPRQRRSRSSRIAPPANDDDRPYRAVA